MSWFDASSFSKYAKTALKNAQKNIDKVLDINDEDEGSNKGNKQALKKPSGSPSKNNTGAIQTDSFFDSFLGNEKPRKKSSTDLTNNTRQQSSKESTPIRSKSLNLRNNRHVKQKPNEKTLISSDSQTVDAPISSEHEVSAEKISSSNNSEASTADSPFSIDHEVSAEKISSSNNFEASTADSPFSIDHEVSAEKTSTSASDCHSDKFLGTEENNIILLNENAIDSTDSVDPSKFTENESQSFSDKLSKNLDRKITLELEDSNENTILHLETVSADEIRLETVSPDEIHLNNTVNSQVSGDNILEESEQESVTLLDDTSCPKTSTDEKVTSEIHQQSSETIDAEETGPIVKAEDISKPCDAIDGTQENLDDYVEDIPVLEINQLINPNSLNNLESSHQINETESHTNSDIKIECDENNAEVDVTTEVNQEGKQNEDASSYVDVDNISSNNINRTIKTFDVEVDKFDKDTRDLENPKQTTNNKTDVMITENTEVAALEKRIEEMKDILEARENKLFQLSKENIELNEAASIYKNQLEQLESMSAEGNKETDEIQKEFSSRVGEFERKLKEAYRERDNYKRCFEELQETMSTSVSEKIKDLTESLIERDETITNLMQEGDSLSKKELEANNRIKKLRVKLKEVTGENKSSQGKISKLNKEIENLQTKLTEKTENETKLQGEIGKLEKLTDLQEDEISLLKDKLDDLEEKYKPIESTLENCYSEINKLNLEKAQVDSLIQEKKSLLETNEELNEKLKELEKKSKYGNEELSIQLQNLQDAYNRLGQQASRREEALKTEISDLQQRLEDGEKRNQELSQSVTTATRPLLRQIENLQSSHASQAKNWERIEKNLTDRLADLQHQSDLAVEKEHSATQYANEVKSKFKVLEKQNREIKEAKLKLELSFEHERSITNDETNKLSKEKTILEKRCEKLKDLYDSLNTEKTFLEEQMSADKFRYENDLSRLNSSMLAQQQMNLQRVDSVSSLDAPLTPTSHHHAPRFSTPDISTSMRDSLSNDVRLTATTASMELLESQLRKRDGEVFVLKEEVKMLEKTKASLARELVSLTNQMEELENSKEQLIQIKEQHSDLQSRYNAVLQMYGEKAEEAEELKMDLADVKAMYKQQIEQLLGGR